MEQVRGEMADWGQVLKSAQQERDGHLAAVAAGAARVGALEQQATEQTAAICALRAQADAGAARVCELEEALQASEEAVIRAESEARSRKARIAELEKATQAWRSALDEMRLNSTDSRPRPELRDAIQGGGDDKTPAPAEAAPDGAVRLLIQTAGGREIVHVLGRRTSIGRTPDNDLQIEAKCVSRRHAVILTGPLQTVIAALNSTNAVYVNGKRINPKLLHDSDPVVIRLSGYRRFIRRAPGAEARRRHGGCFTGRDAYFDGLTLSSSHSRQMASSTARITGPTNSPTRPKAARPPSTPNMTMMKGISASRLMRNGRTM